VKLNKHIQTIKDQKKIGASQNMNNSEGSVSSIATKKTESLNNAESWILCISIAMLLKMNSNHFIQDAP
jgi:hypothetical protein